MAKNTSRTIGRAHKTLEIRANMVERYKKKLRSMGEAMSARNLQLKKMSRKLEELQNMYDNLLTEVYELRRRVKIQENIIMELEEEF